MNNVGLIIHGGAGTYNNDKVDLYNLSLEAIEHTLSVGYELLRKKESALDTVQTCVKLLEDSPYFNAGKGALANSQGEYELDAAIMDGSNLKAGSIAAVQTVKNPILLARVILEHTDHIMLSGKNIDNLINDYHIQTVESDYFYSSYKDSASSDEDVPHGTVGAVAFDSYSNLAAATSTGGWGTMLPGRIGDSPVIGAGTYADNSGCAISCTGKGEDFIRAGFAKYMSTIIELDYIDAKQASMIGKKYLKEKVNGHGGFILIDKNGNIQCAQTSSLLIHGYLNKEQGFTCRLFAE